LKARNIQKGTVHSTGAASPWVKVRVREKIRVRVRVRIRVGIWIRVRVGAAEPWLAQSKKTDPSP